MQAPFIPWDHNHLWRRIAAFSVDRCPSLTLQASKRWITSQLLLVGEFTFWLRSSYNSYTTWHCVRFWSGRSAYSAVDESWPCEVIGPGTDPISLLVVFFFFFLLLGRRSSKKVKARSVVLNRTGVKYGRIVLRVNNYMRIQQHPSTARYLAERVWRHSCVTVPYP